MQASIIIFYCLAAMIIGGAILAVTSLKIFRAAVFLLFSLIGIAGLYFWMNYEFIAAVQIVVYVGGIVVLIIFSIFLTHHSGEDMKSPKLARSIFVAIAASSGFALTMLLILQHQFFASSGNVVEPTVKNIGTQMLSTTENGYLLPFEVISILLLAAMIGAIVIAIKTKTKA
ncbi:MAG: NADH-quinone oxidoreductase subunit J [Bacteroidetes bacterium]|jgi:NADH-quinone oxidoreductase subunit J|nr:NADH-quinone oxidoreductase subunit J [Bacteroidota bacterium]